MSKKLRILAAGDLHGSVEIARRLSKKASQERADVIILAGDIAGAQSANHTLLEPFAAKNQRVLFVPGNWDDSKDRAIFERDARNLHHRYVVYGDVSIAGIGNENWKMELDSSDFYAMKNSFDKIGSRKRVLISHLHAAGTRPEVFGFEGDRVVRKVIDTFQPDLLIAAHIHEAAGIEDKVGCTQIFQVGREGTIIEI